MNLIRISQYTFINAIIEYDPKAQLAIGPTIDNGFYYDFKFDKPFSLDILPSIQKRMVELVKQNLTMTHETKTIEEALKYYEDKDQAFKIELIKDLATEGETSVTFYTIGDFTDLCRGGHVENTNEIVPESFELDRVAGAYWRGSEKNPMLTRIYGLAFESKNELDAHKALIEEARKRDHKKLGPELELYMFHETAPGMPYWLPKGLLVLQTLIDYWRKEHLKRGYQEVRTPLINKKELYVTSGHWEHYRENMFIAETEEKEIYALKAMNCPNAMVIFGMRPRSYKELPLRLSDTDILHRFELSGTLNGLLRAREFSQDDAHIFISEDQIESEYKELFGIADQFYSLFGLEFRFRLGTRPEKFMGDPKVWDRAEAILKKVLEDSGKDYFILEGDGAFYGPKVDILMKDSLGRDWQMGTIQLDFQQPVRFDLKYIDNDGIEKSPVVIHRVIYGSLERFIGILVEHVAGAFPTWLAPVQVCLAPVSDQFINDARELQSKLTLHGIRVDLDAAKESVGKKIRNAEKQKIPYILVFGEKEKTSNVLSVRMRGSQDTKEMNLDQLVQEIVTQNP